MSDKERSTLRRTRVGFVFQFFNLLPTLTAVENVALPLLLGGMKRSTALREAAESLDRIGMGHRERPESSAWRSIQTVAGLREDSERWSVRRESGFLHRCAIRARFQPSVE